MAKESPRKPCILSMVADLHHFNADPYETFHNNADPDPASHQSDANLRPIEYI